VFFSKCLLRHGVVHVLCRSVCLFLYRPFCHGALKLYISTLFTTFFLWTSLKFILTINMGKYTILPLSKPLITDTFLGLPNHICTMTRCTFSIDPWLPNDLTLLGQIYNFPVLKKLNHLPWIHLHLPDGPTLQWRRCISAVTKWFNHLHWQIRFRRTLPDGILSSWENIQLCCYK